MEMENKKEVFQKIGFFNISDKTIGYSTVSYQGIDPIIYYDLNNNKWNNFIVDLNNWNGTGE